MTPELEDDRIDTQLRAWADDLAGRVPPHRVVLPPRRQRPTIRDIILAAVFVAVAAVAVAQYFDTESGVPVASGGGISANYERLTYSQEENLECPSALLGGKEGTAIIEAWGDREAGRWKTRITYGNGMTRDVLVEGDPWYPAAAWERGELVLASLGCTDDDIGVVVAEPAQGGFLSLNAMAPARRMPNGLGGRAVPDHESLGEVVAGDYTDSQGRRAVLWQQVVTGTVASRPVVQTTSWYVERRTGHLLEKTFVSQLDGVGSAQWRLTSEVLDRRIVPPVTFESTGMRAFDPKTPEWAVRANR